MTKFCANCEKNDHESCMLEYDGKKICRRCQLFLCDKKVQFSCECKFYKKNFLQDISKSDLFIMYCEDCKACIKNTNLTEKSVDSKEYVEVKEDDCFDQIFFIISYAYDDLVRKNYNKNFYIPLNLREDLSSTLIQKFKNMFKIQRKN